MVGIFYVQKNILIKQNIGTDRLRDSGNFGLRFETPRNCHYLEMYETRFCRQTIKHMCFIQQTVRMGQAGLIASGASPSADSDSESLDESVWHSRHVDPSEADIYLDAMFGPLFYRFERIRKEQNGSPQWSDYRLVSIFFAAERGVAVEHCVQDQSSHSCNVRRCGACPLQWCLLEAFVYRSGLHWFALSW